MDKDRLKRLGALLEETKKWLDDSAALKAAFEREHINLKIMVDFADLPERRAKQ